MFKKQERYIIRLTDNNKNFLKILFLISGKPCFKTTKNSK